MKTVITRILLSSLFVLAIQSIVSAQINNPARFVQIRCIDFVNQSIEIRNFGTADQPLDGWRFCSHDEDQVRRYSGTSAFNGVTIAAGESIFLKYQNDAAGPAEFNIQNLGNFATPLDTAGAYAIQFYFQTPFGVGDNIADHLQFSLGGVDENSADERSDEAEAGGVWTDQTSWIPVAENTASIELLDGASDNELNGPSDYFVRQAPMFDVRLESSVLIVNGTGESDEIVITEAAGMISVDSQEFVSTSVTGIVVNGLGGDDTIIVDAAIAATISGGAGDDTIIGGSLGDDIQGGLGVDDISGGAGADVLLGGGDGITDLSMNSIDGGTGNDVLIGGSGVDWLSGANGADMIFGFGGNDEILGGGGNDSILGGDGDDVCSGGAGNDMIDGEDGDDDMLGGGGDDAMFGGAGNDIMNGFDGRDRMEGGNGDDDIRGGKQRDIILGGNGIDLVSGQAGNDVVRGGNDDDTVLGGAGSDRLFGDAGADVLSGNGGDDFFNGGAGDDAFFGGAGCDTALDKAELGQSSIEK